MADGLVLDRPQVGQRILAWVVVVGVAANVAGEVEDRVHADGVGIGWRDVEGVDLGALVGVADATEGRVSGGAAADDILNVEVVVGVGGLEPGAADAEVEVYGVGRGELAVDAVEDIELVALVRSEEHTSELQSPMYLV